MRKNITQEQALIALGRSTRQRVQEQMRNQKAINPIFSNMVKFIDVIDMGGNLFEAGDKKKTSGLNIVFSGVEEFLKFKVPNCSHGGVLFQK